MAKTTTNPYTQNLKAAYAYWTNSSGTIQKALQVGGSDYTGGSNDSVLKRLTIFNNCTATASVFGLARLDPSAPTSVQTGTLNSTTAVTGLSDTTLLMVGMPVSGTGIPTGTFISAIGSSTALTLSKAATASASNSLTFTYWELICQVNVPLKSGGDAAGAVINIDMLGSSVVTGLELDQSSKPNLCLPSGWKMCLFNLTAPAASNGGFIATADFQEY